MKKEIRELLNGKPILPGNLAEHYNVCGKVKCRCKDKENPQKHGPYYRLSYSLKGKNSSIAISREDAPAIMEMTNNYRELRDIVQRVGLKMLDEIRGNELSNAINKYERVVIEHICKKAEKDAPPRKEYQLKVSRDNWKDKAVERKSEIEKLRIKLRDLTNSRDEWKSKAKSLKSDNLEMEKLLEKKLN
jgi:transcriptional regulator with GAF, ATPase, and Fis domain